MLPGPSRWVVSVCVQVAQVFVLCCRFVSIRLCVGCCCNCHDEFVHASTPLMDFCLLEKHPVLEHNLCRNGLNCVVVFSTNG